MFQIETTSFPTSTTSGSSHEPTSIQDEISSKSLPENDRDFSYDEKVVISVTVPVGSVITLVVAIVLIIRRCCCREVDTLDTEMQTFSTNQQSDDPVVSGEEEENDEETVRKQTLSSPQLPRSVRPDRPPPPWHPLQIRTENIEKPVTPVMSPVRRHSTPKRELSSHFDSFFSSGRH